MNMNYEALGKNIRKYRRAADLTQAKLGELAGISLSHINSIENANAIPSIDTLVGIANVLNITMDQICYPSASNTDGYLIAEFNRVTQDCDIVLKRCAVEMAVAIWEKYTNHHS